MRRICDLSFAVILLFFLATGTSSNEGKANHWLLVFVIISTRRKGEILAGRIPETISLIWIEVRKLRRIPASSFPAQD